MDRLNVINVKRQCFEGRHQGYERARGMGGKYANKSVSDKGLNP